MFTVHVGLAYPVKVLTCFYVTVIKRNMHTQLLKFQNGAFSQDSCYSAITRFY